MDIPHFNAEFGVLFKVVWYMSKAGLMLEFSYGNILAISMLLYLRLYVSLIESLVCSKYAKRLALQGWNVLSACERI